MTSAAPLGGDESAKIRLSFPAGRFEAAPTNQYGKMKMKMNNLFYRVFCILSVILLEISLHGAQVVMENCMRKFSRDEPLSGNSGPLVLDAMRNEHELFQIVIRADGGTVKSASVEVSDLKSASGARISKEFITVRRARYIYCDKFVEKKQWYPDALPRCEKVFSIPAGQNQAIYIDLFIPPDTAPGIYCGEVKATLDNVGRKLPFSIRVHNILLSSEPTAFSAFAIWGWSQLCAPYPGIRKKSAEYRCLYKRVYDFLTDYRLSPTDLPVPLDSPEADAYFNNPKIKSFRVPYHPGNPEALVKICDRLRRKGVLHKAFVYTLDERPRSSYPEVAAYADRIHRAVKDIRYLLTIVQGTSPLLEGKIDIWCPILNNYDEAYFRKRQRTGEQVWWYTCVYPQMPYPTYLINDDGIAPRMLNWLQAKFAVEGNLYWAVNIWKKYNGKTYVPRDCWTDPLAFPGANGDGFLLYPAGNPEDEPVPSLRLELIRQGNEDFDMLSLLKAGLTAVARKLRVEDFDADAEIASRVNRIARGTTDFSRDPAALEELRRNLLAEIENLGGEAGAIVSGSCGEGILAAGREILLRVAAPPGASVSVSGTPGGLIAKAGENAWRIRPSEAMKVVAAVTENGKTAEYIRIYEAREMHSHEKNVLDWSNPEMLKKLKKDHVVLFEVPGSQVRGFRFLPGTAYSNVKIPLGDSQRYQWIKVELSNPSGRDVECTLKLHAVNQALDGNYLHVPAYGRKTYVLPCNVPGSANPFHTIEIWKTVKVPQELVIESISLHEKRPRE